MSSASDSQRGTSRDCFKTSSAESSSISSFHNCVGQPQTAVGTCSITSHFNFLIPFQDSGTTWKSSLPSRGFDNASFETVSPWPQYSETNNAVNPTCCLRLQCAQRR